MPFDRQPDGNWHLTREGGHQARRVLHSADTTGHAIESTLLRRALAEPAVQIAEEHYASDLWLSAGRCAGAWVLAPGGDRPELWTARAVILASGGAGQLYLPPHKTHGGPGGGELTRGGALGSVVVRTCNGGVVAPAVVGLTMSAKMAMAPKAITALAGSARNRLCVPPIPCRKASLMIVSPSFVAVSASGRARGLRYGLRAPPSISPHNASGARRL